MSDLISRNRAISILEQLEEHSLSGKMDISNAIYLLNNQPTAYSVDKVVEELEGAMWLTTNDDGETNNLSIQVVSFEDAIEIVNNGGVRKDVE